MKRSLKLYKRLSFRLIFWVGVILLATISTWAYFNIEYQKKRSLENVVAEADRLGNTIKLGTHYAMMLNSRDDINQITRNIGRQKEIENIRIYNKQGHIKFSNNPQEIDLKTNIQTEACYICHKVEPPLEKVSLAERKRIVHSPKGSRSLGIISPISNDPSCSTGPCHVHPQDKKVLGLLDLVISLEHTDQEIASYEKGIIALAIYIFLGASGIIGLFLWVYVNRPMKKMIMATRRIGNGEYDYQTRIERDDEIGELAVAINQMGKEIGEKQDELNKQKEDYQKIFELAPCYITVQDRGLKLIRYNQQFAKKFHPREGDFCYQAYKNRTEPCPICPVLKTFEDGQPHFSEETAITRDGTESFWLVRTSPILNAQGEVVAAMELCLDMTQMKLLEKEVHRSEQKYQVIFNTIPNPVFVLDELTLGVLDCNDSVTAVYGFSKGEILGTSFLDLFQEQDRGRYASEMRSSNIMDRARQTRKDKSPIYVNIRISLSEYLGRNVLLVTTSDITKRLVAEQQLIQTSKMATLGEMATGVAHELNQPLAVIKTASSFLLKKVKRNESIPGDILTTMAEEIDSHVDRASKIITHMREFGRKSEVTRDKVQVNEALKRATEIFNQQLKLREIQVVMELQEDLPLIWGDRNRLEQVFINLLINARDSIEEKFSRQARPHGEKKIYLRTRSQEGRVQIHVKDTGTGIPSSIIDKVFEPFFTTKKVGQGTGLGLSISYGIVQDYDGTISVESQEGGGADFTVSFPIAGED